MSLVELFASLPICPACEGARELTETGLCYTCTTAGVARPVSTPLVNLQKDQPMFEPLFKRTSTGAVQTWQIRVEPQDDGTAIIVTGHGQIDGKIQEGRDHIKAGKNPGKKNATTPVQQAIKEAESKWTEKRDRDRYGLTVEESDIKMLYAPMLAQSWLEKGKLTGYAKKVNWDDKAHLHVQPKFDGHRSLAVHDEHGLRLFTRKGVEVTTCGHIADQLRSIMPVNTVLDGELYTHGVPVTTIGGYISKAQEGTQNLCFMMYDTMIKAPFAERMEQLVGYLRNGYGTHLHLSRTQLIRNEDELMDFQGQCVENDYEGAMFRHGTEGYANGDRSASLLKVKTFVDDEFVVVGCRQSDRGKYEGAAIFECVTPAGHKFDCTAPGNMATKRAFWEYKEKYIGGRLIVKYQKYTETAEPVPFQPVAKGFY
jgi:hypothetical protein